MNTPAPRPPSPAEQRLNFSPAAVDVLAARLHELQCPHALIGCHHPPGTRDRTETERAAARFLLIGLRAHGYTLTPTPTDPHPTAPPCPAGTSCYALDT